MTVEETSTGDDFINLESIQGDHEAISYHVKLLAQAGYLEYYDLSTMDGIDYRPKSLTWAGHEFLDAARNNTIWNKAMAKINDVATSASLELVKKVLTQTLADSLGVT